MPVPSPLYPVGLVVAGRPCLVVGGGPVAHRKIGGLLAAGADVTVVAPAACAEVEVLAEAGTVTWHRRPYRAGEAAGHRLVLTATGDPAVDGQVFADAEAAGVWVNSADDPDRCSFTLPAVLRRGPLTVAVATGGHSPAVAAWVRDLVAGAVGPEVDELLALVAERRRQLRDAGVPTEPLDWSPALRPETLADLRAGRLAEARARVAEVGRDELS